MSPIRVQSLDRLKSQLLTSGIQHKDQPLYQVINQLIDVVRSNASDSSSTSATTGSTTLPTPIAPTCCCVILTDGDPVNPQIIFDDEGNVIMDDCIT